MKKMCYILLPVLVLFLGCGDDKSNTPSINQIIGADEPITLAPGAFKEFAVNVDLNAHDNAIIRGEFSVRDGEKITVLVMSSDAFTTWRANGSATTIFSSGQISNGEVDETIDESGNYYVVFSNKSDSAKEKRVFSSIALFTDVGDEF